MLTLIALHAVHAGWRARLVTGSLSERGEADVRAWEGPAPLEAIESTARPEREQAGQSQTVKR